MGKLLSFNYRKTRLFLKNAPEGSEKSAMKQKRVENNARSTFKSADLTLKTVLGSEISMREMKRD
jgi:hypothetical protein